MIYIDYLEKGKTDTGLYYAELLGRFDAKFQKKSAPLGEEKSALPAWQRTGSHLRRRHRPIGWNVLYILPSIYRLYILLLIDDKPAPLHAAEEQAGKQNTSTNLYNCFSVCTIMNHILFDVGNQANQATTTSAATQQWTWKPTAYR